MKWEAAPCAGRPLAQVARRGDVAGVGGDAGERVEGEDLDRGVVVAPGVVEDRDEPLLGAGDAVVGVHRGEQALAERGLLAAAGAAVPGGRRLERRARRVAPAERAQDAPEVDAGERRQAYVAGGLGLLDRELQRGGAGRVVARLALRASEARDLVGLRLQEAEPPRRLRGAADVQRRRRRSDARCGPARRASRRGERAATGRRPSAASARPGRAPRRRARGRRPRSRLGRRRASSRPGPTAGPARRRARRCDRSAPSPAPNSP